MSSKKDILRVIQVSRKPSRSPEGVMRRPRIIRESVEKWFHQCMWCDKWFPTNRKDQFYCGTTCRGSAFRDRSRAELEALRKIAARRSRR